MAGLFFCLASDTVQGFCFAVSMQLYNPRHKTAHGALQRHFLRLYPLNRPRYQHDKSGYNNTCATLEGIHASEHVPPMPDTTATPDAAQVSTAAYYNKVYKRVQGCACYRSMPDSAAYCRQCQRRRVSPYRVRITGKCCTRRTC